ncbi:tail fiber domain-containing protein [Paraflavitalea speifideaquila]|uniref:tail fiber domain-containing protein n=1 Tax=Paraflavitalea speifideaquila TaxID=3076558 RepID=UPI0028E80439|nr:tail fiber domain-containing protein [Paraflavitalea speifideiaquila]
MLFDPVVYKFNGKGGTVDNGIDYIGLIAQDVKKVMPELVISQFQKLNPEDSKEEEVLTHDLTPLVFMFINAIKELNDRLEKLEKPKKMKNDKPVIHLELTIDEVNLVLTALGQLPYVQVVGMVDNIRKQAETQWVAKAEATNNH